MFDPAERAREELATKLGIKWRGRRLALQHGERGSWLMGNVAELRQSKTASAPTNTRARQNRKIEQHRIRTDVP